jgi:hypothetical protein
VANIGADGKLFKKVIGTQITAIPPENSDVITVAHKNTAAKANAVTRYLAIPTLEIIRKLKHMIIFLPRCEW